MVVILYFLKTIISNRQEHQLSAYYIQAVSDSVFLGFIINGKIRSVVKPMKGLQCGDISQKVGMLIGWLISPKVWKDRKAERMRSC
jgi:hypothetical protein